MTSPLCSCRFSTWMFMSIKKEKPLFIGGPCECRINYHFTESLLVLFQKSSGQQTHEVLSTLETIAQQMATDFEVELYTLQDLWYFSSWRNEWKEQNWRAVKKKIAVTYPGTDITCYLEFTFQSGKQRNAISYNFYMPIKKIVYTSEKMSEINSEGIILDTTEDLKEMKLRSHPTPQQLRDKRANKKTKKVKIDLH